MLAAPRRRPRDPGLELEVYQSPPQVPTDESAPLVVPDPLNPRLSYGAGKIISEIWLSTTGASTERALIFRRTMSTEPT